MVVKKSFPPPSSSKLKKPAPPAPLKSIKNKIPKPEQQAKRGSGRNILKYRPASDDGE